MTKFLATILSQESNYFKKLINNLELSTGDSSCDLKLTSEIKIKTNQKLLWSLAKFLSA